MSANTSALPLPSALPPIQINRKPLWIALLLVLAGALYLNQTVSWRQGALWIVGALLGVALYHASFGFTQAWRVFVSDRRGAGLTHPNQLRPHHIARRISSSEIRLLSALFPELAPGELLRGEFRHQVFRTGWSMARADSFQPTHDISTALAQEYVMAHPPQGAPA